MTCAAARANLRPVLSTSSRRGTSALPLVLFLLGGCAATNQPAGSRDGGASTTPLDAGYVGDDSGTPTLIDSGPSGSCVSSAGQDVDGDGFPNGVDCDDCNAGLNPGAYDEPGNGVDEDCSGADATTAACDTGLPLAPSAASQAAQAMGICATASDSSWGLVSSRFVRVGGSGSPDGSQTGILPTFGATAPVDGASMLALSSGVARAPGQSGYTSDCDLFGIDPSWPGSPESLPAGFTVPSSPSCPGVVSGGVYNSVALELVIKVPTNATGFSFRSNFVTYEYPNYICSQYNDYFVALMQTDAGGWENIVFDSLGNPVSVNNGLLAVCEAGDAGGTYYSCDQGRSALSGTGFDSTTNCGYAAGYEDLGWGGGWGGWGGSSDNPEVGAGTGWLQTVSPVTPGSTLTLRFAIWDSGDSTLDSLVLIDGFQWEVEPVDDVETTPVVY